jgi:hypothetical protein
MLGASRGRILRLNSSRKTQEIDYFCQKAAITRATSSKILQKIIKNVIIIIENKQKKQQEKGKQL